MKNIDLQIKCCPTIKCCPANLNFCRMKEIGNNIGRDINNFNSSHTCARNKILTNPIHTQQKCIKNRLIFYRIEILIIELS